MNYAQWLHPRATLCPCDSWGGKLLVSALKVVKDECIECLLCLLQTRGSDFQLIQVHCQFKIVTVKLRVQENSLRVHLDTEVLRITFSVGVHQHCFGHRISFQLILVQVSLAGENLWDECHVEAVECDDFTAVEKADQYISLALLTGHCFQLIKKEVKLLTPGRIRLVKSQVCDFRNHNAGGVFNNNGGEHALLVQLIQEWRILVTFVLHKERNQTGEDRERSRTLHCVYQRHTGPQK